MYPLQGHVRLLHLLHEKRWRLIYRLNNSHIYHTITHDTANRGIDVEKVSLNLPKMLKAKNDSVKALTGGIETYLFKKYGVDYVKGAAAFNTANKLDIKLNEGGETQIEAKNVIIATGSEVTPFPGIEIDEERIVSSTGALDLQEVPKKVSLFHLYSITSSWTDGRHWRWYHRS
jgi:dihydrolipoamide dehydrogenase